MKHGRMNRLMTALLLVSLICPPAFAGEQPESSRMHKDIQLDSSNAISLTVVGPQGQRYSNRAVTVRFQDQVICRTKTDVKGRVRIAGLRPGLHTIESGMNVISCRFWTQKLAPPNAIRNPAFVVQSDLVRGQYGPMMGPPMAPMGPAVIATGVTAAALAVVLIGKSSGNDSSFVAPASP